MMNTMKMMNKEAKKKVCEQIINMLNNDILLECGTEPFVGWCEDGVVFDDDAECVKLMNEVSDFVDMISYKLNPFNED